MLLKRHYDSDALAQWIDKRDAEIGPKVADIVKSTGMTEAQARKLLNNQYSDAHNLPTVSHIEVKHCGDKQNLNQRFIDKGIVEGWLSIGNGKITIKTDGDPLEFDIKRVPGHYSCFDGSKLNGEDEAKAHVIQQDAESPNPAHPSGYIKLAHYECVRV